VHRVGRHADLASWHHELNPLNRFDLVLVNSFGAPAMFAIRGGAGRPSDLPRGIPVAVAMIHSHSAVNPTDPQTIAGRWLAQGAFVYFGAVNEPYLLSFRTPSLVAELMAAEIPFVAALRQCELEPFGFPWRLVYLGDPLYRLRSKVATPDYRRDNEADQPLSAGRMSARDWRRIARDYADWPVTEIAAWAAGSNRAAQRLEFDSEGDRLRWCLDAAIGDLVGLRARVAPPRSAGGKDASVSTRRTGDWRAVLRELRRDRLDRALRPVFDELLIEALGDVAAYDELLTRLAQIAPDECGPRVWQALEHCGTAQLARLVQQRDTAAGFRRALDVWDRLMRLNWPQGSQFPSQFTERVASLVKVDVGRRQLWIDRLREVGDLMAAEPLRYPHAAVVATERARMESLVGGPGRGP
jgi:hypothetical protein